MGVTKYRRDLRVHWQVMERIDGVESPFVSISMWRPDTIAKPEGTLVSYVTY